ncbi:MAG: sulfite exporter TauE/SafE family protein [Candidatus Niyogibacteria bacterium]|nr:sulfite exporter TauE/SafE family protein [Candidatus Niyogibacteria bacterium]
MGQEIFFFVIVGFIAQIIDGALGMAYGVISTSFLLTIGISPAAASASVHTAEIFISGVSGLSHFRFGNIDKDLFKKLLIPGVLGGVIGAYILSSLPGEKLKPLIALYLFCMGIIIVYKALKKITHHTAITKRIIPLGFIGGFFDAIGGGGWGPIVTSTLIARGGNPRLTIGSVNMAEFFVTLFQSFTFIVMIGLIHWKIIVGLLFGGVIAAPFAAYICKRLPTFHLMIIVGLLIALLSLRTLFSIFL